MTITSTQHPRRKFSVTEPTQLAGVKLVAFEPHADGRGENLQLWCREEFREATGLDLEFVQDHVSVSHKGVLRGIHVEPRAYRYLTCLAGRVFVAVCDLRQGQSSYLHWAGFFLQTQPRRQLLVPPMCGIGALVLEDDTLLHYKWSEPYDLGRQWTVGWDDPRFDITWPPFTGQPILSERDSKAQTRVHREEEGVV